MGDASCTISRTGAGSGAPVGDGGKQRDATIVMPSEAGTCGTEQAGQMVASVALNPTECVSCIVGGSFSSEAGGIGCCMSDSSCSNDSGCLAILQCALACRGNAACVGMICSPLASQASVSNYQDFGSCLMRNCPQCPWPMGTPVGDL